MKPSELNEAPSHYNGQTVIVAGYVIIGPETHFVYESKQLLDEMEKKWRSGAQSFDPRTYAKYCLTIENPGAIEQVGTKFQPRMMVISGKFVDNYLNGRTVDLGACALPTAIIVDKQLQ